MLRFLYVFLLTCVALTGSTDVRAQNERNPFEGDCHVEITRKKKVKVTFTIERVSAANESVSEWVAFASIAPELAQQSSIKSQMRVFNWLVNPITLTEIGPAHRRLLCVRVPAGELGQNRDILVSVEHEAILSERRLVAGKPAAPIQPLSQFERDNALMPSKSVDYENPSFAKWLDQYGLVKRSNESDIGFAYRIYLFLSQKYHYQLGTDLGSPVSTNCWHLCGSCGHYSNIFVVALRANHIPARSLIGHWVVDKAGKYPGGLPHVKSEFFVPSIGWVPVDASAGQSADGPKSDKTNGMFGREDGDFLTFHTDVDYAFETPYWGVQEQGHFQGIFLPALNGIAEGPTFKVDLRIALLPLPKRLPAGAEVLRQ